MLSSFLSALAVAAAAAVTPVADLPAAIDSLVAQYKEDAAVPGVAVAVTRGSSVVHIAGHGRTPTGEAVSDRTILPVASVSKSMTARAVLTLVENGRIRLDDPVMTHLPEFVMADPRAAAITVRMLLDQTSGMSDTTIKSFSGPEVRTLREAVAAMRGSVLAAAPGARWEYHNPNFQVAARLVEVVSGQPFAEYLSRNVFEPLDMKDSRSVNTADDLPPSARGHVKVLGMPFALPETPGFGNGSGGVLSTARDMAAWLIAQNQRIPVETSSSYALGWFVGKTESGQPLIHHGGDLMTSTAYQALLPASGYGIAVMANTGTQYRDAQSIGERLIALLEGRPVPPPNGPPVFNDAVLLLLAVPIAGLAVRGVRRARERRRSVLWLLVLLVPLVLVVSVHHVVGFLYRGRDVAWSQVFYLYPTFMATLVVTALGCAAVFGARLAAMVRRAREDAPHAGH
ncbi:serine hydrolase domain-containing protein [Allokutzneria albata]|uniref:CubicO group peptidase, beta-lactamase class C family n=1 Tax=Allokutzneria albata TaxID=211114 RepID=A0A1G9U207_ALLAB|nr:serine hydrolase domain-containing protein [Allokutzneria albata]SDM53901.1 CubicO group peptidase, beta-lactamase class C family [Allokutzneria albata]